LNNYRITKEALDLARQRIGYKKIQKSGIYLIVARSSGKQQFVATYKYWRQGLMRRKQEMTSYAFRHAWPAGVRIIINYNDATMSKR